MCYEGCSVREYSLENTTRKSLGTPKRKEHMPRRMRHVLGVASVALIAWLVIAPEYAQSRDDRLWFERVETAEALRGTEVKITVGNPLVDFIPVTVSLMQLDNLDNKAVPFSAERIRIVERTKVESNESQGKPKTLAFLVPSDIPLGRYRLTVKLKYKSDDKELDEVPVPVPVEGPFRVVTKDPIKITAVYPAVSYPVGKNKTFTFTVLGEGFSPLAADNVLIVEGRGKITVCADDNSETCGKIVVSDNAHELHFTSVPLPIYGPMKLRVRVGDRLSEQSAVFVVSQVSHAAPTLGAMLMVAIIAGLLWFFLRKITWRGVGGRLSRPLDALFLDPTTNTYSLSKAQFYAWTAAALYGYAYLTIARSLVQGVFEFAEMPENLPGIVGISAFTAVVAQGVGTTRPKGAGEVEPSLADFITTGGVVAPERLQFFAWTLIGVAAFLLLIVMRDPGVIQQLPTVPTGFL